ncbi:titin-like [Mytilus trossulus]|uniref:titin-like n=1 Tax=Mytilus trossulus TaxID=6551 RepID=UPI003007A146
MMTKVKKQSVLEGMIEEFISKMKTFSVHLFNAKWQYDMYKQLVREIPVKTAVCCMDYAENFTCKAQDAPQGFHWSNIHCTIHPIVANYICNECEQDPVPVITDSIIYISDDLTHDHHGVQHFVGLSIEKLQEECNGTLQTVIQFSDGAPTQYKNKISFTHCSFSNEDFGIATEKHFFGSRHGKGPCDREIGVLKKTAKAAVAAGSECILSPREFFNYCNSKLILPRKPEEHSHTRRRFVFVEKKNVKRNFPERTEVRPLKDTRKFHCIRSVQPHVISTRERSCFCESCMGIVQEPCTNAEITGNWSVARLAPLAENRRKQTIPRNRPQPVPDEGQEEQPVPEEQEGQPVHDEGQEKQPVPEEQPVHDEGQEEQPVPEEQEEQPVHDEGQEEQPVPEEQEEQPVHDEGQEEQPVPEEQEEQPVHDEGQEEQPVPEEQEEQPVHDEGQEEQPVPEEQEEQPVHDEGQPYPDIDKADTDPFYLENLLFPSTGLWDTDMFLQDGELINTSDSYSPVSTATVQHILELLPESPQKKPEPR